MRAKLSIFAAASVGVAACSNSAPPPSASIEVDRATCESGLTTIATFDGTAVSYGALAVAPDGTAFVTNLDVGILSVPPSGGPGQMISDYGGANRAWVDGGTLWLASFDGTLRTVPTTGGTPVVVGQIPDADPSSDAAILLPVDFALDESHLFLTATHAGDTDFEVWSIARHGGAAQMLFSSSDPEFQYASHGPLAAAGDSLYFGTQATSLNLMRLPKTGGTPVAVRPSKPGSFLVPFGAGLWSNGVAASPQTQSGLGFIPLDPAMPPEPVGGIGFADMSVADGANAYVGFVPDGQPASSPWVLARLPNGAEQTLAIGCTANPSGGIGLSALDMALTTTHVYALLADPGTPQRFLLVRGAR